MNEPICSHCGKTLNQALREGCKESPCVDYMRAKRNREFVERLLNGEEEESGSSLYTD